MKPLLFSVCFALIGILVLIAGAALYLDSSPNQVHYYVYVDERDQIFINQELSNEDKVHRIGADMTVDLSIDYHPASRVRFCFQIRGCMD